MIMVDAPEFNSRDCKLLIEIADIKLTSLALEGGGRAQWFNRSRSVAIKSGIFTRRWL